MDSFVFTRHTPDCKFKRDRLYRRCNCPKWVEGRFNRERIRKSASTRLRDEAERFREKLEEALTKGLPLSGLHSVSAEADPIASSSLPDPAQLVATEPAAAAGVPSALPPAWSQPDRSPRSLVRQKERVAVQKAVNAYMLAMHDAAARDRAITHTQEFFRFGVEHAEVIQ